MKTGFAAALAFVCFASAAHAATLTISLDQPGGYMFGDTVTITVTGDSQGATATGIFGRLLFTGAPASVAGATPTQTTLLALGSIPWLAGVTTCSSSSCDMFNQVGAFGATPAPASNLLVSTVSVIFNWVGTMNLSWETNPSTGFALDFFGLTNAPGLTIPEIPEPTTALLLGLGLAGLATTRRRRG